MHLTGRKNDIAHDNDSVQLKCLDQPSVITADFSQSGLT